MIINTNHFRNFGAAVRYYKAYGFNREAVQLKLKRGEIKLGEPTVKTGGTVTINDEERYVITLGAN
jgi:hypothetical protein